MPLKRTAVFNTYESKVRSYCRDFPAVFTKAQGHTLWDTEGVEYTDLLCGAGSLNYGHNEPKIVGSVQDYLTSGGPVQSLDLHTSAKAEFITAFQETVMRPRGMDYVIQFPGPAGTLAVEAALKLARKVTGRTNIVAFTHAFHGASLGSLAATSAPTLRNSAGVHLSNTTILPYDGFLGDIDTAPIIEQMLRPGTGIDAPAAILLETVQGEGGLNAASKKWLGAIRAIADAVGALIIVDDIQAGCGRTGQFLSTDFVPDLRPDIICLSKSLSGMGLPLAVVLIERSLDVWKPGQHNGTFRGHNLAFVAATEALGFWQDSKFVKKTEMLTNAVRTGVESIVEEAWSEGRSDLTIKGRGAMTGIRFRDPLLADCVQRDLFKNRVIAETSGGGHVLKLFPPLNMPLESWTLTASTLRKCVLDAFQKNPAKPSAA